MDIAEWFQSPDNMFKLSLTIIGVALFVAPILMLVKMWRYDRKTSPEPEVKIGASYIPNLGEKWQFKKPKPPEEIREDESKLL